MSFNKDFLLTELRDFKNTLVDYLRHPLQKIKNIPDWSWGKMIAFQVLITAFCGGLSALVQGKKVFGLVTGMISMPFLTFVTAGVSTFFFYYAFQIFANITVSFRKLFTIIVFANIPFFFFQIIASYVPPIVLVGLAFSSLLMIVGFVEHFSLPKKRVVQLISALYIVFLLIWIAGKIESMRLEKNWGSEHDAPEVELGN